MIELLRAEIDLLWHIDDRGRIGEPHQLVVATAVDGVLTVIGAGVPDELAEQLAGAISSSSAPSVPPTGLDTCQRLLGDVTLSSGPTYLIEPGFAYPTTESIVRSDGVDHDRIRALGAPTWEPDEWNDLIDGKIGPWAMAVIDDTVASICHTARQSDTAVEAGAWTDPAFRGRGLAAATTAAWAQLVPAGVHVFYSTWAENVSSQRVAARLGLRCIGWLWKLTPTSA